MCSQRGVGDAPRGFTETLPILQNTQIVGAKLEQIGTFCLSPENGQETCPKDLSRRLSMGPAAHWAVSNGHTLLTEQKVPLLLIGNLGSCTCFC